MGVDLVYMISIIYSTNATYEFGTLSEHICTLLRYSLCTPSFANIDSCKIRASCEHVAEIFNLGSIEMAQVKSRQTRTCFEHAMHIHHILCIEVAKTFDGDDILALVEPTESTGKFCVLSK